MKLQVKPFQLQLLALSGGLLGFLLRHVLFATGTDASGMLIHGHWTRNALMGLSLLVLGLFALGCRFLTVPAEKPSRLQSLTAGAGAFLCAGYFLMAAATGLLHIPGTVGYFPAVLCLAAAVALVYIGIQRCLGRTPHHLAHILVCLFFAVQMVSQYRRWNSDPQLSDYLFHMLAHVAVMLAAYHSAALDGGLGGFQRLWFFGLTAVYLCVVSVYGNSSGLFMAACGVWVLTSLPCFRCESKPAASSEGDAL